MYSRLIIFVFGLLFLTQSARADEEDQLLWNFNIASAVDEAINDEAGCPPNPYALYRRGCGQRELSLDFGGDEGPRLTLLDRLALFVYRYKDLNLDADLQANTKLKFTMSLANLYEQEAKARVELRIRW